MTRHCRLQQHAHRIATATATAIARTIRAAWRAHRERLASNAAYGTALAALAAALVTQDRVIDLLTALLAGALAIYRSGLRDLDRP